VSKRLQIVIAESEYEDIARCAQDAHLTLSEWVRSVLRKAKSEVSPRNPELKLLAIKSAMEYSFPIENIEELNSQITQSYMEIK